MVAAEDVNNFDNALFVDVLVRELQQKPGVFALSVLAGAVLCIGDFVMACAIDLLGVAVACPLGFGIPLTLGTSLNYLLEPKADPRLLFPGVLCCLGGMLSDAVSHANRIDNDAAASAPHSSASCQPAACAQSKLDSTQMVDCTHIEVIVEERGETKTTSTTTWNWRLILVPILGGSCCAASGPLCTAAGALGGLDPYVIAFAFMIGQICTVIPLLSTYVVITGTESLAASSPLKIPRAIIAQFSAAVRKTPRSSAWNAMAGICTGTGWFLFQLGTPVVSRAVGFIFGSSGPLTCTFYGVFIFREFDGQPLRAKLYSALATLFFATAMVLMTFASL
jgi:hypothetical protein